MRAWWSGAILSGGLLGCAQVLDIPERETDSSLRGTAGAAGADMSGSSGQSGAGQGGDGQGGGGPLELPTCAQFCKMADQVCRDIPETPDSPAEFHKVYPSLGSCEAVCARLTPGDPSSTKDLEGNTLLCRYNELRKASQSGELGKHCPAAGLGGSNETEGYPCAASAGSALDFYCEQMDSFCPGIFPDRESCKQSAAGVPLMPPSSSPVGEGNSLQCRFYHLIAASEQPDSHCMHAGGAAPCCEVDPETFACKTK